MIILTNPYTRLVFWMSLGQAGDVDIKAVGSIDPTGVDNVVAVPALALNACGIDVEKVGSLDRRITLGNVVITGMVIPFSEVFESGARDLSVDIPVPGKHLPSTASARTCPAQRIDRGTYLSVPPPPQQSTVGQPTL